MHRRRELLLFVCVAIVIVGTVTVVAQNSLARFGINTR